MSAGSLGVAKPARESITWHALAGHGHASGYSRAVAVNGKLYVLWSDVAGDSPMLAGAVVSAPKRR